MLSFLQWLWPALEYEVLTLLGALSAIWEIPSLTIFLPMLFSLEGSCTLSWPHQLLDFAAGLGFLGAVSLALGGASSWTACRSLGPPGGLTFLGFLGWMEMDMGSEPHGPHFSRVLACVESFELFLSGVRNFWDFSGDLRPGLEP